MRNRLFAFILLVIFAMLLSSCGRKGDPSPRRDLHRQVNPPSPAAPPDNPSHG
ncbi:MAG: LPS translocon maturation chaperone LptM [Acidobacteriota bacterium]